MIYLVSVNPENLKIGDVVVFENIHELTSHRIIDKWQENGTYYFTTLGDNNGGKIDLNEYIIHEDRIVKKLLFRIPVLNFIIKKVLAEDKCDEKEKIL